jgi:hypothetical protein
MMTVPITTWKVRERERRSAGDGCCDGVVEVTRQRCIIGCVQVLNKKLEEDFDDDGSGGGGGGGYTDEDLHWLEEWNTLIGVSLNQAHNHERFIQKVFKKGEAGVDDDSGGKKRMLEDDALSSNEKRARVSVRD